MANERPTESYRLLKPLLLLLLVAGWGLWMFLQIDHFNLPSLDSLFYFAPAAFATTPFHLSTPLLAGFEGADTSWGANWPGGLLLISCFTAFLPKCPALYVILFLALWLLISALTGLWVRAATGKSHWGLIAFLLCLFNRDLYEMASLERHELLACLALMGAAYGVFTLSQKPFSRSGLAILLISFFLLPLVQPVTSLVGGFFLAALACFAWWRKERPGYLLPAGGAYAAGLAGLALYFYRDPNAWLLFLDNARENAQQVYDPARSGGHFFFGKAFLKRLFRVRFIPTNLIYVGALIPACLILREAAGSILRRETRPLFQFDKSRPALAAFLFVATLSATQFFSNIIYPVLAVPFAVALICSALEEAKGAKNHLRAGLVSALLLAISIAYFAGKTWVMARQGWPNYRRELAALKAGLPPAHLVLIPYVMWETVLGDSQGYAMNTTPNFNARKLRYESMIYGEIKPGDLVLLDSFGGGQPAQSIGEPQWEKIGEKQCLWHASESVMGFDITIWRKR